MEKKLENKKIAVLVENGFEQVELTEPIEALKNEGAEIFIISNGEKVKGWKMTNWGDEFKTDVILEKSNPENYDALLLPGGVLNPDKLRMQDKAIEFVKHFTDSGKPIAAICHGPVVLIETGILKGKRITSYPSVKTDLINAGANWVDQQVVSHQGIVTSRTPDDIPAFNKKMIEEFAEGKHERELVNLGEININF